MTALCISIARHQRAGQNQHAAPAAAISGRILYTIAIDAAQQSLAFFYLKRAQRVAGIIEILAIEIACHLGLNRNGPARAPGDWHGDSSR